MGCLPYALLALPEAQWHVGQLALSIVLTALVGAAAIFADWSRLPRWTRILPPLAYMVALAVLRNAAGGANVGVGALGLLPVLWLALYGTRAQLVIVLAALVAFFAVPVILVGGSAYPGAGMLVVILFGSVAGVVGVTVHGLVDRIRAQAEERAELMARLSELAHTDPLTGLPNRRAWTAELERALQRARRTAEPLTLAMLDLDDFKAFNDTFGHGSGDRLLEQTADALRAQLRPDDVIARLGGDEFAILLPDCDAGGAAVVLKRLLAAAPTRQTYSIGLGHFDGTQSAAALLHDADVALYGVKHGAPAASATGALRSATAASR